MLSQRGILSVFLLLLPVGILLDGLMIPLVTGVLLLLLIWPQLKRLRPRQLWLGIDRESLLILALLTVWPLISVSWTIMPGNAIINMLKTIGFLSLGLLGLTLAKTTPEAHDTKPWECFAVGVLLAAFSVALETLPQGGLLLHGAMLLNMSPTDYYDKGVNKGICLTALATWISVIAFTVNKKEKLALWTPWLILPSIFYLFSLTAQVGSMAALVVFYGMRRYPKVMRALVVWGLPAAFAAWPAIFVIMKPILTFPVLYDALPLSSQHRIGIWDFAMNRWLEKPIFGWGADSSRDMPHGNDAFRPYMANLPLHPHNIPLQILLEHGIIGFALHVAAIALIVRRVMRFAQFGPVIDGSIAAMMTAYIAMSFTGFSMWQAWWVITPIMLSLITLFCLQEYTQQQNRPKT